MIEKNESALRNIYDINGFEFLNALKSDLKDENKRLVYKVDEIIDRLINLNLGTVASTSIINITNNTMSTSRPLSPRHVQANTLTSQTTRSAHSASSSSSSSNHSSSNNKKSTMSLSGSTTTCSSSASSSNNINSLITSDFNLDQFKQTNNMIDLTSSSSLSYKLLSSYDHNNLTSRTNTSESTLTNNNNNREHEKSNSGNNSLKSSLKSTSASCILENLAIDQENSRNKVTNNNRDFNFHLNFSNGSILTQSHSIRNDIFNVDHFAASRQKYQQDNDNFSNHTHESQSIKFQESVTINSQDFSMNTKSNSSNNGFSFFSNN